MALKIEVIHDPRVAAAIEQAYRSLPKQVVNKSLNRVIRRHLISVRHKTIQAAGRREGIRQKFLRRISDVKVTRKMEGVFWFVAGSWLAKRMAGNLRYKRGGRIVVWGGTLVKARTLPAGTRGYPRKKDGRLRPYSTYKGKSGQTLLPVSKGLEAAFVDSVSPAPRDMYDKLMKELRFRTGRHFAMLRAKLATRK